MKKTVEHRHVGSINGGAGLHGRRAPQARHDPGDGAAKPEGGIKPEKSGPGKRSRRAALGRDGNDKAAAGCLESE